MPREPDSSKLIISWNRESPILAVSTEKKERILSLSKSLKNRHRIWWPEKWITSEFNFSLIGYNKNYNQNSWVFIDTKTGFILDATPLRVLFVFGLECCVKLDMLFNRLNKLPLDKICEFSQVGLVVQHTLLIQVSF